MARTARGGGSRSTTGGRTGRAKSGGTTRSGRETGRAGGAQRATSGRTTTARSGRAPASKGGRSQARTAQKRATAKKTTQRSRQQKQDAIALLKADHVAVKDLFKRYESLGGRAMKQKQTIAHRLIKEISVHDAIERQVLYPTIRDRIPNGEQAADHALEEHKRVAELLAELDDLSPDDDRFDEAMQELMSDVRAHIKEEESQLFRELRSNMDREGLVKMGDLMRLAKKAAPTRPHPRTPMSGIGTTIAGAPAAIVDRMRDVLRPDEKEDAEESAEMTRTE